MCVYMYVHVYVQIKIHQSEVIFLYINFDCTAKKPESEAWAFKTWNVL